MNLNGPEIEAENARPPYASIDRISRKLVKMVLL